MSVSTGITRDLGPWFGKRAVVLVQWKIRSQPQSEYVEVKIACGSSMHIVGKSCFYQTIVKETFIYYALGKSQK